MSDPFHLCQVHVSGSLHDVLWALDKGGVGVALVVDRDDQFIGTITDGDVRRGLLRGYNLESPLAPHVCRTYTAVKPQVGRAEVLDLMRALTLEQIPIVDDGGRLVGLHLIHQLLGAYHRPNWAVILAGGKGTRLRPITQNIPKPMIKVAGRPLLERLVLHLVSWGVRRIFLAINYLGHMIEDHFGDGSRFSCQIEYLREEEYLGTGGALSLLPERPTCPLLVFNGDLVTEVRVGDLLDHHAKGGQLATVCVRSYIHQVPFGCIQIEGDRLVRFEEKPILSQLINAGIYVLDPALVRRVPRSAFPITNLMEECLRRGEHVAPFEVHDDWVDVGQPETLKEAREGKA